MRVGARRDRAAELRRAVAEDKISLRRAQENHGTRQQELLAQRFHDALKRDRFDRANRPRHNNHHALFA